MSGKSVVTVVDKRTVHTDALDILGRVITEDDKVGRDAIHLAVEPVIAGQTLHAGMQIGRRDDGTFGYTNITKTLGIVDPFIQNVVRPGEKFFLVIYPRQITTLRHVWEHTEFGPEVVNPAIPTSAPEIPLYHLILESSGPNKINAIKAIRAIKEGRGLKEAKDYADNTPCLILENVTLDVAKWAANHFAGVSSVKLVEALTLIDQIPKVKAVTTLAQIESKAWITDFASDLKKNEYGEEDGGHTLEEIMAIADNYLDTGTYGYVGNSDIYEQDWKAFWMHFKILTGREPANGVGDSFFSCSC